MNSASRKLLTIGSEQLEAYYDPSPLDGYNYSIEVNLGKPRPGDTRYFPRKLADVAASEFPDSCDLNFESVPSSFRHIHFLNVRKKNGLCNISATVSLCFSNWDLPESLSSFVDRYSKSLIGTDFFTSISAQRSDYGFDLICTASADGSDDLFSDIEAIESKLESVYRNSLIPDQSAPTKTYGEERRHWWIRYVIVPILCSGSVAGVLAYYLFD